MNETWPVLNGAKGEIALPSAGEYRARGAWINSGKVLQRLVGFLVFRLIFSYMRQLVGNDLWERHLGRSHRTISLRTAL
jgi:hypothetical protein